jgi:hypothetical protein
MTHGRRELTAQTLRRLTVDPEPWLSCDDCFRLVDEYVDLIISGQAADQATELPQFEPLRVHLAGCAACSEEAATLLQLAADDAGVDPDDPKRRLFTT